MILLVVILYFALRSHSTKPDEELSHEFHREEIKKEKEAWQQKQTQVDLILQEEEKTIHLGFFLVKSSE